MITIALLLSVTPIQCTHSQIKRKGILWQKVKMQKKQLRKNQKKL